MERLNKVFLDCMRALLNGRREDRCDWPRWVPAVQECLNKVLRVSSRGDKTPTELLLGRAAKSAVHHIVWMGVQADMAEGVSPVEVAENLEGVHAAMEGLWAAAVAGQQVRRQRNGKKGVACPSYR